MEQHAVLELDWLCFHAHCRTISLLRSLSATERLALVSRALNLFKLLAIMRAHTKSVLHRFFEVQPVENIPDVNMTLLPEVEGESQLRKRLRESLRNIEFLFGGGVQAQVASHVTRSHDLFVAGCREVAEALAVLQVPKGHWPNREVKEVHKAVQKTLREVLIFGTLAVAPGMDREAVVAVFEDVLGTAGAGENAVSQCTNGLYKTLAEAALLGQGQTGKKPVVVAPDPRRLLTSIPEEQEQKGEDAKSMPTEEKQDEVKDNDLEGLDALEHAQLIVAMSASRTEAAVRMKGLTSDSGKKMLAHAQHIQAEAEKQLQKIVDKGDDRNVSRTTTGNTSSSRGSSSSSHGMVPITNGGSSNNTGSSSHSVQPMEGLESKNNGSSSRSSSSCSNSTGTMDLASVRHLELIVKLDQLNGQLEQISRKNLAAPRHLLCEALSDSDTNDDDRMSCSSSVSSAMILPEYCIT